MSPSQLVNLIKRDGLNVEEESQVYQAVIKWVRYDEENRYPKMEHILSSVRCQFLTPSFLKQQMNHCDVLRRLPACREYLAKIFKVHFASNNLFRTELFCIFSTGFNASQSTLRKGEDP